MIRTKTTHTDLKVDARNLKDHYIHDLKYRVLGMGSRAVVVKKPEEDFVLKIGRKDHDHSDAWLEYILTAKTPFKPIVDEIEIHQDSYIAKMERLLPIDDLEFNHLRRSELAATFDDLFNTLPLGCATDFHSGNVMKRPSTLAPVITDPWVYFS